MNQREIKERYNPNETNKLDDLIANSYDAFVRLERRNLLLISSVILISSFVELKPTNVSAFGFEFENLSLTTFYVISLLLNIYFIVSFIIYADPIFRDAIKLRRDIINNSGTLEYQRPWYFLTVPNFVSNSRFYIWISVHFILPVIMGFAACIIGVIKIA
jgi:hypothetical protein